ncbi:hypothetical protein RsoM2USA_342 [Ralstonia phage RsoM2USA]|nr:hypothetical protein RsoM2USA_342 [Ralstonia phage RsoM2USA]
MKLSEIYDYGDFEEWMYQGNILDPWTGKKITAENAEEDIADQLAHNNDGSVSIMCYTGDCNFVFNVGHVLTPPVPIDYVDVIGYGYGTYKNIGTCWPKETPTQIEFHNIPDIQVDDLVNRLKDVADLRIKFSGCKFIGSLANFMELHITDPDNFFLVGDTPNIDKLIELFHRGFDERMNAFEFQDLLIENGFDDLV